MLLALSRTCGVLALLCFVLAWWAWPWFLLALGMGLLALLGAGSVLERLASRIPSPENPAD